MTDLLPFPARREPAWTRLDLRSLVGEVVESLAPRLRTQGIVADLDLPDGTPVLADTSQLRRAVLHLILNACDAMPRGGELDISCWFGPRAVELEVADSGPGLDSRTLTSLNGAAGQQLPAHLDQVRRIAETHGGRLRAANCPQGGAAFTLVFPRRALEAAA
ncbi:MAG: HAMP domain-containing histidine kinase [Pirellulaceae bacterium]|nr:HAMP domain-containing histidine kinase [Pirellulaceae bacterium]